MTGVEVAVGFLIAWAVKRAKHLGDGLGKEVDQVSDKALESLHDLVSAKLGSDPVLAKVDQEVAQPGGVSDRTRQRIQLSLEEAVEDTRFAAALDEKIKEIGSIRPGEPSSPVTHAVGSVSNARTGAVVGTVSAQGHGMAFGTVIGPMTVHQVGKVASNCHCSRDAIGACVDCREPLCQIHNQAARQRRIDVANKTVQLTLLELWAVAADKVICGSCLTAAEDDLIKQIVVTNLPDDPNPVVRLIALADREYWSTRQMMPAWVGAVDAAAAELGGTVAVFEAAAAAVLKREEFQFFPTGRRGEGLEGAIAGEEILSYQGTSGGMPTGRLAVVDEDLYWYYVHGVAKPGHYSAARIPDVELQSISRMMDLAAPAFADYVHFPAVHDLMPDPWRNGALRSQTDVDSLRKVLVRHRWMG